MSRTRLNVNAGRGPTLSVAIRLVVVPSGRVPVATNVIGFVLASFRKLVGSVPPQPPPLFVSKLNVGEAVLKLPGAGETVTLAKLPVTLTFAVTTGPGAAI